MQTGNGTQNQWRKWLIMLSLFFVAAGSGLVPRTQAAAAPSYAPPGPDRFAVTTVDYTRYFWWMLRWGSNERVCEIEIDHEGMPTPGDVYVDCGQDLYQRWVEQRPCTDRDVTLCKGFYVYLVDSEPAQKQISTALPPPTVQVTLENCSPVYSSSTSICEYEPVLVLTGIEPVPGYQIIGIEGLYEGQPFACDAVCRLKLPITGEQGFILQFWAYSSYGDSSEIFDAQIRVAVADTGDPDRTFWYVDVLSSQWVGVPLASCVGTWGTLPPVGGPPEWLSTPPESQMLNSDIPYSYLAAQLIKQGAVDVSMCLDGGILPPDDTVSACGMEAARTAVTSWQNQFDEIIWNVGRDTGVPARLLKNLFANESQFWPGAHLKSDIGLGQLTVKGADTTFLWNPPFFYQFCPLVMDSAECSKGYLHLDDAQQEYVRLALIDAVNANCDECPLGVDLERANFSIGVFAHTMLANCEQAGQLVENVTGEMAGKAASYENLWKFTLVNYNAGPGCLGQALEVTQAKDLELNWENLAPQLEPACQGAINYVNEISR